MNAEIPTAEVIMERFRMVLAEAGYPDAPIRCHGYLKNGYPKISTRRGAVPLAIWWQASEVVFPDVARACWACFSGTSAATVACIRGKCQHPEGPARAPRDLLRAS